MAFLKSVEYYFEIGTYEQVLKVWDCWMSLVWNNYVWKSWWNQIIMKLEEFEETQLMT